MTKAETKHNACFPAGTRITTDKGLKRIEDIQVGDMVLSKHESGIGEQEFKPVIRTVVHHNKPIFELTFAIVKNTIKENGLSDKKILNLSSKGEVYTIRATPNHPFWVKGQGWTSLDKLQKGQLLEMKESNTQAYVIFVSPQYQTNYSNIVATYGFENDIIFDEQSINNLGAKYELEQYDEKGDRKFLSTKEIEGIKLTVKDIGEVYVSNNIRLDTVYNFEVADNHTYYIGDFLWVHNACPKFTFEDVKSYNKNVPVPKSHSEISKQLIRAVTKDGACFPAGTRITTDKGLKRIEDIQVGDMVLSKHESGIGEQEFKPVIRTVVHHNKPIFELTYAIVKNSTKAYGLSDTSILNLSRKGKVFGVKATPNHPFWVKGQGWTNLEDLKKGQLLEMKEEGYQAYVILSCPEYQTNHTDVKASLGFTSVTHLDQFADKNKKSQYTFQVYSENGDCTELLDGRSSHSPVHIEGKGEIYVTDNPRRDTVYNFEVADNHTYYIFDKLWVHDVNVILKPENDSPLWTYKE